MENEKRKKEIQRYAQLVKRLSPKSEIGKGLFRAFWVGGVICMIGQGITDVFSYGFKWGAQASATAASITLIFLSALLTGLSLYDNIAKHAGAGTLVPITGFANAIAAPAVEFQTEGRILGTAAKMFTIAGPVIVYGLSASVVYGLIYWLATL